MAAPTAASVIVLVVLFAAPGISDGVSSPEPVKTACTQEGSSCPENAMLWASGTFVSPHVAEAVLHRITPAALAAGNLVLDLSLCCNYTFKQQVLSDKTVFSSFITALLQLSPDLHPLKLFRFADVRHVLPPDRRAVRLVSSPFMNTASKFQWNEMKPFALVVPNDVLECKCPQTLLAAPLIRTVPDFLPANFNIQGGGAHCVPRGTTPTATLTMSPGTLPLFTRIDWHSQRADGRQEALMKTNGSSTFSINTIRMNVRYNVTATLMRGDAMVAVHTAIVFRQPLKATPSVLSTSIEPIPVFGGEVCMNAFISSRSAHPHPHYRISFFGESESLGRRPLHTSVRCDASNANCLSRVKLDEEGAVLKVSRVAQDADGVCSPTLLEELHVIPLQARICKTPSPSGECYKNGDTTLLCHDTEVQVYGFPSQVEGVRGSWSCAPAKSKLKLKVENAGSSELHLLWQNDALDGTQEQLNVARVVVPQEAAQLICNWTVKCGNTARVPSSFRQKDSESAEISFLRVSKIVSPAQGGLEFNVTTRDSVVPLRAPSNRGFWTVPDELEVDNPDSSTAVLLRFPKEPHPVQVNFSWTLIAPPCENFVLAAALLVVPYAPQHIAVREDGRFFTENRCGDVFAEPPLPDAVGEWSLAARHTGLGIEIVNLGNGKATICGVDEGSEVEAVWQVFNDAGKMTTTAFLHRCWVPTASVTIFRESIQTEFPLWRHIDVRYYFSSESIDLVLHQKTMPFQESIVVRHPTIPSSHDGNMNADSIEVISTIVNDGINSTVFRIPALRHGSNNFTFLVRSNHNGTHIPRSLCTEAVIKVTVFVLLAHELLPSTIVLCSAIQDISLGFPLDAADSDVQSFTVTSNCSVVRRPRLRTPTDKLEISAGALPSSMCSLSVAPLAVVHEPSTSFFLIRRIDVRDHRPKIVVQQASGRKGLSFVMHGKGQRPSTRLFVIGSSFMALAELADGARRVGLVSVNGTWTLEKYEPVLHFQLPEIQPFMVNASSASVYVDGMEASGYVTLSYKVHGMSRRRLPTSALRGIDARLLDACPSVAVSRVVAVAAAQVQQPKEHICDAQIVLHAAPFQDELKSRVVGRWEIISNKENESEVPRCGNSATVSIDGDTAEGLRFGLCTFRWGLYLAEDIERLKLDAVPLHAANKLVFVISNPVQHSHRISLTSTVRIHPAGSAVLWRVAGGGFRRVRIHVNPVEDEVVVDGIPRGRTTVSYVPQRSPMATAIAGMRNEHCDGRARWIHISRIQAAVNCRTSIKTECDALNGFGAVSLSIVTAHPEFHYQSIAWPAEEVHFIQNVTELESILRHANSAKKWWARESVRWENVTLRKANAQLYFRIRSSKFLSPEDVAAPLFEATIVPLAVLSVASLGENATFSVEPSAVHRLPINELQPTMMRLIIPKRSSTVPSLLESDVARGNLSFHFRFDTNGAPIRAFWRAGEFSMTPKSLKQCEFEVLRSISGKKVSVMGQELWGNASRAVCQIHSWHHLEMHPAVDDDFFVTEDTEIQLNLRKEIVCGLNSTMNDDSSNSFADFGTVKIIAEPKPFEFFARARQCLMESEPPMWHLRITSAKFVQFNGTEVPIHLSSNSDGLQKCSAFFLRGAQIHRLGNTHIAVKLQPCPDLQIASDESSPVMELVMRNAVHSVKGLVDFRAKIYVEPTRVQLLIRSYSPDALPADLALPHDCSILDEPSVKKFGVVFALRLVGDKFHPSIGDGSGNAYNSALLNGFYRLRRQDAPAVQSWTPVSSVVQYFRTHVNLRTIRRLNDTFVEIPVPPVTAIQQQVPEFAAWEDIAFAVPGIATMCRGCLRPTSHFRVVGARACSISFAPEDHRRLVDEQALRLTIWTNGEWGVSDDKQYCSGNDFPPQQVYIFPHFSGSLRLMEHFAARMVLVSGEGTVLLEAHYRCNMTGSVRLYAMCLLHCSNASTCILGANAASRLGKVERGFIVALRCENSEPCTTVSERQIVVNVATTLRMNVLKTIFQFGIVLLLWFYILAPVRNNFLKLFCQSDSSSLAKILRIFQAAAVVAVFFALQTMTEGSHPTIIFSVCIASWVTALVQNGFSVVLVEYFALHLVIGFAFLAPTFEAAA